MQILAVDTGGTFTDLAAYDTESGCVVYSKSLTTYDDLTNGILDCIGKTNTNIAGGGIFKHGTTLAINALLSRTGGDIALVTTRGFRDVLELARGNRPDTFDLFFRRDDPLVPREFRIEIDERVDGKGNPLAVPRRDEVEEVAALLRRSGIRSVAVAFMNSYLLPRHEELVAGWLRELLPDVFVTCGTELSREWYEYERTATAASNAYVGPQVSSYIRRLDDRLRASDFSGRFLMMGSNGGALSLDRAMREPVMLVESGPVGGCIGAAAYAQVLGFPHLIAFDMGGTTAKCALVEDGRFDIKSVYHVGGSGRGFPIRGSVIDIVEVSAGGGSIAWLDGGGSLKVGPRSAGSSPGPACYGRGGSEPTVTDANVVLGRLAPDNFLGGELTLDNAAAERAIAETLTRPLGLEGDQDVLWMASGIIAITSVIMAGSIKRVSVERGRDPRDHVLFAYGGGGPLHAADLARELHIPLVVIPPEPGNFSAVGMLLADLRRDRAETRLEELRPGTVGAALAGSFAALEDDLRVELLAEAEGSEIVLQRSLEMRYRGQVHSLLTPYRDVADEDALRARFETLYLARFGHVERRNPIEIVSLHVTGLARTTKPELAHLCRTAPAGSVPAPGRRQVYVAALEASLATAIYRRAELPAGFAAPGPAVIEEYGSTTFVGPHDRFEIGRLGEIRVHIGSAGGAER